MDEARALPFLVGDESRGILILLQSLGEDDSSWRKWVSAPLRAFDHDCRKLKGGEKERREKGVDEPGTIRHIGTDRDYTKSSAFIEDKLRKVA